MLLAASPATQPTEPLVAAAALLAWTLAGWLLLVALLTACSRLPGLLGNGFRRALHLVAPAAVRRAVALALGAGVVLGGGTGTALAASHGPARAAGAPAARSAVQQLTPQLGSPAAPQLPPSLDWPTAAPPFGTTGQAVVVRPGDTLWDLAAARLPDDASDARVAAAWPAWWSTNREVIGPDPDLLHPGQRLVPPAGSPTHS